MQIEAEPGVVTVVAAWMLDPVACAGMEIGSRRVSVDALIALHRLLCERGYRRSSPDDAIVVQEERDGEPEDRTGAATARRELSLALDCVKLRGISPPERAVIIVRLARMLLEAGGIPTREHDDERNQSSSLQGTGTLARLARISDVAGQMSQAGLLGSRMALLGGVTIRQPDQGPMAVHHGADHRGGAGRGSLMNDSVLASNTQ